MQVRRRAVRQWPFLAVIALLVAAVVYLAAQPGHWERGTAVIAVAMLLAALLRCVLPESRVGLLGVRGRWWDVPIYLALGVLILVVDIRLKH